MDINNDNTATKEIAVKAEQAIGKEEVRKAVQIFEKYRQGRASLEERLIENEKWWRMRHGISKNNKDTIEPKSAWLFNTVANKHADAMDNYPCPNILPREQGDEEEAQKLSSIIPVILEENCFERIYSDAWWAKLKGGTGVYGVFWNNGKQGGLGDIDIQKIDMLNVYFEPGITDIQDSRNVFYLRLIDNDILESEYEQLKGNLSTPDITVAQYASDEAIDTSQKSAVVDWYYKKNINGKTVLHYCKFVNDTVLFATENEEEFKEKGLYEHGKYPFVFDVCYSVENSPTGFGCIDIAKDTQMYIDKLNAAILTNSLVNAQPRVFLRDDSGMNEEEYLNPENPIVHVQTFSEDIIAPVNTKPLSDIYVTILNNKIDELKETTGNRDVSSGGATGGVTAASAIAAMQEAGNKLSRDAAKQSYVSYGEIIELVIELIRQFYDEPRCFRITGETGEQNFVSYDNANIKLQQQGGEEFGIETGYRLPVFDIEISAEKNSPYSKLSQNELALQFYSQGFFNPQLADQALACLDMMDFDRKNAIMQKIRQNGTMFMQVQQMQQQMLQMSQIIDGLTGTDLSGGMLSEAENASAAPQPNSVPLQQSGKESGVTENARKRVSDSVSPL